MARFKGKAHVGTQAGRPARPDLLIVSLVVTLAALLIVLLIWFLVDPVAVRAFLDSLGRR